VVGLVKRESCKKLLGYFAGDFESSMWESKRLGKVFLPRTRRLGTSGFLDEWSALSKKDFEEHVGNVEAWRGRKGILGLELGFAPPKSVSLACFLDQSDLLKLILGWHLSAVDEALEFISRQLLARKKGQLIDCGVRLFEFLHPANRAGEPQLHSHVVVLKDFDFSHALWTTPLFLLQRTLREVYHYSLCSRFVEQGLRIRLGGGKGLAWELQGIHGDLLREFSKASGELKELAENLSTGFFSQGAEFRIAAWASRRLLADEKTRYTLAERQKIWIKRIEEANLPFPALESASIKSRELEPVCLEEIFRLSSTLTREQFIGAHLRFWLGSEKPFARAVKVAEKILDQQVKIGNVFSSDRVYCWRQGFKAENEIRMLLQSKFGKGTPVFLKPAAGLSSQQIKVLSAPHGIKLISTQGKPAPSKDELFDQSGMPFTGNVFPMQYWESKRALDLLTSDAPTIIFVEEPSCVGDFLNEVETFLPVGVPKKIVPRRAFKYKNKNLIVLEGDLTKELRGDRKSSGPLAMVKRTWRLVASNFLQNLDSSKKNRRERASLATTLKFHVVTGGWLSRLKSEELRDLNWNQLSELTKSAGKPVQLYRPVPPEILSPDGNWDGLAISAFKNVSLPAELTSNKLKGFRQSSLWSVKKVCEAKVELVSGTRAKKELPLKTLKILLQKNKERLLLVRSTTVFLKPGIPLACPLNFRSCGQFFRKGEVLIVRSVGRDGSITFHQLGTRKEKTQGSLRWPTANIIMEPSFFVSGFVKNQSLLPVIDVQVDPTDSLPGTLDKLPACRVLRLFCSDAVELCRQIEFAKNQKLAADVKSLRDRILHGESPRALSHLFPTAAEWWDVFEEWESRSRSTSGPATPVLANKSKSASKSSLSPSLDGKGAEDPNLVISEVAPDIDFKDEERDPGIYVNTNPRKSRNRLINEEETIKERAATSCKDEGSNPPIMNDQNLSHEKKGSGKKGRKPESKITSRNSNFEK